MTGSYKNPQKIDVIVPYGNPNGALHFRFAGDYKTFCGRECEGWSAASISEADAINSAYCCKRCKLNYLK